MRNEHHREILQFSSQVLQYFLVAYQLYITFLHPVCYQGYWSSTLVEVEMV